MLTQQEYEEVLRQKKEFTDALELKLGPHPIKWTREIISKETHETFLMDFNRNSIKITKYSVNKRYRKTIVLIRYCSDVPHTNPEEYDGKHFDGPHLHLYQEGFDDKIAVDPGDIGISATDTMDIIASKLLTYFNVVTIPIIQNDLF